MTDADEADAMDGGEFRTLLDAASPYFSRAADSARDEALVEKAWRMLRAGVLSEFSCFGVVSALSARLPRRFWRVVCTPAAMLALAVWRAYHRHRPGMNDYHIARWIAGGDDRDVRRVCEQALALKTTPETSPWFSRRATAAWVVKTLIHQSPLWSEAVIRQYDFGDVLLLAVNDDPCVAAIEAMHLA